MSGFVDLECLTLQRRNDSKRNLYKYIASFVSPPFNAFIIDPLPPTPAALKSSKNPRILISTINSWIMQRAKNPPSVLWPYWIFRYHPCYDLIEYSDIHPCYDLIEYSDIHPCYDFIEYSDIHSCYDLIEYSDIHPCYDLIEYSDIHPCYDLIEYSDSICFILNMASKTFWCMAWSFSYGLTNPHGNATQLKFFHYLDLPLFLNDTYLNWWFSYRG